MRTDFEIREKEKEVATHYMIVFLGIADSV